MSFKVPTFEEIETLRQNKDVQVPSLFKSRRIAHEQKAGSTSTKPQPSASPGKPSVEKKTASTVGKASIVDTEDPVTDGLHGVVPSCAAATSLTSLPKTSVSSTRVSGASSTVGSSSSGVVLVPVTTSSAFSAESSAVRQPKANSIIVSPRQRGNPILKFIRNVPWEFGDIVADYQLTASTCALYLSLRYHNLKPDYIHERLRQLAKSYVLRILLVQVDVKDSDHALKELAKICILTDCTLILAFTLEEAGRYLETYKSFENKPPDMIMEKTDNNYLAQVTDTLTAVKKVNKTDAVTLLSTFGSVKKIIEASEQDLSLCPGLGPQKASRLQKVFHQPFLKEGKKPPQKSKMQEQPS